MAEFFYSRDEWMKACLKRGWILDGCNSACKDGCDFEKRKICHVDTALDPKTKEIMSVFKDLIQMGVIYDPQ